MKVTLTESGGFANIKRRCTVDTVDLPSDVGARLESIIPVSYTHLTLPTN